MEQPIETTPTAEADTPTSPSNTEGKFSALPARILSALALVIVAGTCLYQGGMIWLGFMGLCATIMLYEWYGLTKNFSRIWQAAGILYVGIPCGALYVLQHLQRTLTIPAQLDPQITLSINGTQFIINLILMVAATDIGAYFSGKLIGGAKLAPKISPNKTWAGLLGGMICAMLTSALVHYDQQMGLPQVLLLGAAVTVLGQSGDIFESWLKRRAGVKDSGKILPGHGGLLDRFDGLTLSAPCYMAVLMLIYGAVYV